MLELIGIIVGIAAGASILLFGSKGLSDLIREAWLRRRRSKDKSPADQAQADNPAGQAALPVAAEGTPTSIVDMPASPPHELFVGRHRELGVLTGALQDVFAGRGRMVMLAGEPGIGKTRTIQELASRASSMGFAVLWGRCYEDSGTPPYWPWIEVIRTQIRALDTEQLISHTGPGAADIAEIVPEVKTRLPDIQPSAVSEPEQSRFRLFDSITAFLTNSSQSQPLVLALEDLHWADTSSLRLLEFLVSRIASSRLMVVGAYRSSGLSPEHPLNETLANLSAEPIFRLETLRRFSTEETGSLIEATVGVAPTPELILQVQQHTEGNPLFVSEVVRLLEEKGHLASAEGGEAEDLAVPEGVRAVTRQRLRRLSPICNQALSIASFIGKEFDFGVLQRLIEDGTQDGLKAALDEAVQAHLVEELPRQPGRYQFNHSLIKQALAEEHPVAERAQLHARIGEALESYYKDDAGEHAVELAHHFAEAEAILGAARFLKYSRIAGEQALDAYAYEEALIHFQRALRGRDGKATDGDSAAVLFGLGRAQAATIQRHQLDEVLSSLGGALDYYIEAGEIEEAVAVAEYPLPPVPSGAGVTDNIRRVLELVTPESHEAGRLLSRYGWVLGVDEGDYGGAREAFSQALAIARREDDAKLEMQTLANAARVDGYNHRWEDSLEKSLAAIGISHIVDNVRAQVEPHYRAGLALLVLGSPERAAKHAASTLELAEKLRDRYWLANGLWMNELTFRLQGDWAIAIEYSDRGLAIWPRDPRLLGTRTLLEYEIGNREAGEAHLERLLEAMRMTAKGPVLEYAIVTYIIPLVARITGASERLGEAEQASEVVLPSPSATSGLANDVRVGMALLAIHRQDAAGAQEQYSALEGEAGQLLLGAMASERLLGLLAGTMGQRDRAVAHFEDALSFCRKANYRPELAWTCCDYGEILLQRSGSGDLKRATSLLSESLAISTELGMRPLMDRVTKLQART